MGKQNKRRKIKRALKLRIKSYELNAVSQVSLLFLVEYFIVIDSRNHHIGLPSTKTNNKCTNHQVKIA